MKIELFPCSGGMAEGFRRAGITFDLAVDKDADACDSYEANLGHRPVQIDVRDLLRLVNLLVGRQRIKLLVADPPCTPWSRAGKRLGVEDERDMLGITCELILTFRPQAYLIGNVPGLEDSTQWHHLQAALAPLARSGYCIKDFVTLDAADYGVPQHRVRPFWFGHLSGPCIQWPMPTHCDPAELLNGSLGLHSLKRWVTCRDALGHLSLEQLGRACRLRKRLDAQQAGDPNKAPRHDNSRTDRPAHAIGAKDRGQGTVLVLTEDEGAHPQPRPDEPAPTIRGGGSGHSAPQVVLALEPGRGHFLASPDEPARTLKTNAGRVGDSMLELPQRIELGNQPPLDPDEPVRTITANGRGHQAMVRVGQGDRVGKVDAPSATQTAKASRIGAGEAQVLEWPWSRPGMTVTADPNGRMPPPGHHDSGLSQPNAVVLSELAGTILQGFPESWVFAGKTKRSRWSMRGQAMPPPLAEAVARSVAEQMRRTDEAQDRADDTERLLDAEECA